MSAIPAHKAYSKIDFLKLMQLSREGDRREGILLRQSRGWFQVSAMGHEALGVLGLLLRPDDYLFPYYRDRVLALTRGMTSYELALAYFAKESSSSGGRQMPGHYSSHDRHIFSVCTPTGGSLLPACGAAWAMKLAGGDSICLTTVGDAATRQGEFFEAIAFAVQEKLPIIFLVEDNKYGISTPTDKFLPFHLGILNEKAYVKIDGRLPDEVHKAGLAAVERARSGDGPTIIWADIDRLAPHTSSDDHRIYRASEDLEAMLRRDPIRLFVEDLIANGELTPEGWETLQKKTAELVDQEYQRAEKERSPNAADKLAHLFGPEKPAVAPPIQTGQRTTMVAAINATFRKALEADPKVIFFGEDIEDPKGGVFGITKGLSAGFPKQVHNSPLAEATIMGIAVGLAAYGYRPVFELQFVDFIAPGWNQITTNMATLRWRSFGDWKCPLVVYAPYGAYLPGGSIWHSQCNEGILAHVPGIRVAIPSTPEDAAGLFWTAIHGEDPSFILIPKHIFRKQTEVTKVEPLPFGKAKVVREGADVTLVTWGNCLELAHEAAERTGARVEIIDLRSIVPCDYDTVLKSLSKTGRLVVVHEDGRTCGFGQALIAEVTTAANGWDYFLSPPQLVAGDDVHIGFNPIYEYAALPDVQQVLAAIDVVMT